MEDWGSRIRDLLKKNLKIKEINKSRIMVMSTTDCR